MHNLLNYAQHSTEDKNTSTVLLHYLVK